MKCLYYPGCSQKATASVYEQALMAIAPHLGLELSELDDWNCCGATLVPAVNKVLALSLSARNLALAERQQGDAVLLTPCPSCSLNLTKAHETLTERNARTEKVRHALAQGGLEYKGGVKVRHLLEFLLNTVGLERIRAAIKKPLSGLRVAPYYGCQVVRPHTVGDDPSNPQNLEKLITALGAEPAPFPMRTACCGGALVATQPDVGDRLVGSILDSIHRAEATAIVTPCSLCQVTLEMAARRREPRAKRLPTLNIAQLVGLALGLDEKEIGIGRLLVPRASLKALQAVRTGTQASM